MGSGVPVTLYAVFLAAVAERGGFVAADFSLFACDASVSASSDDNTSSFGLGFFLRHAELIGSRYG